MTGIITLPLVPLRVEASERSEMVSQLLFGECVEILETRDSWLRLRNLSDNFSGWADRKMIKTLTSEEALSFTDIAPHCISVPLMMCKNASDENLLLPGGSLLPNYAVGKCVIADEVFTVESNEQAFFEPENAEQFSSLAKQYLNAPYLLGGKSIFGIDCSGLVQVIYSIGGIFLPRETSQQVEYGEVIDFLSEAKEGDLAFFENTEGKIIHVGIMLNSHQIIHASGRVKIETIDNQGIISSHNGEYSHKLRVIKRII
jgi:gamma-D-glutamyl-L-lysine dipeptidyl-peptidase